MVKFESGKIGELVVAGDFLKIADLRVNDEMPRELRHQARDVLDAHVGAIDDVEVLSTIALYGANFGSRISAVTKIGVAGDQRRLERIWSMQVPPIYVNSRVSRAASIVMRRNLFPAD